MTASQHLTRTPQPIAIVGVGAIMPEAPTAAAFWTNITEGRYCITDVPKDRWDPDLYYDPDPRAPDKTYSRIGGWVREFPWDPIGWRLPLPPKVSDQMDDGQKWAVSAARAGAYRRRLAEMGRGPGAGRGRDRQRPRRREALRHEPPHPAAGVHPRTRPVRRRSPRCRPRPGSDHRRDHPVVPRASSRRSPRTPCPASWRTSSPAGSRTCSTSSGPSFTTDAACASGACRPCRGRPRAGRRAVRRRRHRRRGPQYGRRRVRQVLQDRGAVRDGHTPVRRRRRRLRHGRGRGIVRPQAPRRRRAGRRPDLRGAARGRRRRATARARESPPRTRSGSGSRSSAPGTTPASTRPTVLPDRGARHLDPGRRRLRTGEPDRRVRRRGAIAAARSRSARSSPTSAT